MIFLLSLRSSLEIYVTSLFYKQIIKDSSDIDGLFKGEYLSKCQKKILDVFVHKEDI